MDVLLIIGIGIVIGVGVGFAARLLVPGREALSMQGTIVIGIFAAIAGGFVADGIGWGHDDAFDWRTLVVQLGVAVVIVAAFHIPTSRRSA